MPENNFPMGEVLRKKFGEVGSGWDIKGIIDSDKRIYTISNDTKLISTVFELIARPLIYDLGKEYSLKVYESTSQTIYPDFTLAGDLLGNKKVAVDVKTTYRRFLKAGSARGNFRAGFTLGSFTAYLRRPTKNILFPYSDYSEHWIVGFIYTRESNKVEPEKVSINQIDAIQPPIKDIEVIVQQKYQISSDRPGSGNTANIGSINDVDQLRNGTGPFAKHEPHVFDDYWRNFMTVGMARQAHLTRPYVNLETYFKWRSEHPHETVEVPTGILDKYTKGEA